MKKFDTDLFITQWNDTIGKLNQPDFMLVKKETRSASRNILEDIIARSNISEFPIGAFSFYPELTTVERKKYLFGYYDENSPMLIDIDTGEIFAKDPYKDDANSFILISESVDSFLFSLIHYFKLYIETVVYKKKILPVEANRIVEMNGGLFAKDFFHYIFNQIA